MAEWSERNIELGAHALQRSRDVDLQLQRFDHAWTGDEE